LVCSALGLRWPTSFAWLLVFQVIYKSIWLATYVLPRLKAKRRTEIPTGITLAFVCIVLTWPWFIPWRQMVDAL